MNLLSKQAVKELLNKYGLKPSKGLGQNFLIDATTLEKIIEVANIKKDDNILEVGPGLGVLTQLLAERAGKVIAVEKDNSMIEILSETLAGYNNIEIINDDILKYNPGIDNYKIVANIPYYLTSPLIRKFLELKNKPKEIIIMVQKEVAQRICADPPRMSILATAVQFYADAKIAFFVPKNYFWPAPKVDSAVIVITPKNNYKISSVLFFEIVRAGFSHPRKQLVNNLTTLKKINGVKLTKDEASSWLILNKINPSQRPETLSVSDWVNLTKSFNL